MVRTLSVCPVPGCGTLTTGGRCAPCARAADQQRGSRQQRGYDAEHDRLRRLWAPRVATGTVACARCHQRIPADAPWALDHNEDRTGYLGPSHTACNNAAGGRAAHKGWG